MFQSVGRLLLLHTGCHDPGLHPVLVQGGGPRPAPEPGRLLVEVPQVARPQEEVEEAEQHRAGGPAETARGPLAVLDLCISCRVNMTAPRGERLSPTLG